MTAKYSTNSTHSEVGQRINATSERYCWGECNGCYADRVKGQPHKPDCWVAKLEAQERKAAEMLAVCFECDGDGSHSPDCVRGREIEEESIAASISRTNAERDR